MSKFYSILLGVLCLSSAAFAQTPKGTTQVGVSVGLNISTVSTSNVDGYNNVSADSRPGFNAGVTVEHYFSDRWSMKGKVLYDQKGWNNGYIAAGTSVSTTNYQLDYITVPVLANWHFGHTRNWYLDFGPYVAFLTSVTETAKHYDVKSFFQSTDAGLHIGIGVKFPISETSRFFVEYAGQGGITNISSTGNGNSFRNSVSAFNIGVLF